MEENNQTSIPQPVSSNATENSPQSFVNTNGKSGFNLGRFFNRKTFGLLVVLILVAVVPLVVMVSQQSQDIRQRAASSSNLLPANLQSATFTNDPGAGVSGRVWAIPQQSITTAYVLSGTIENLAAKVRGVPYKAEIAVDIYDNQYPAEGHKNGNYDTRIISSSNASENVSGPKTFTVNANYKAFVIFRTYNTTANFKNVSLASKATGPCYGKSAGTCTFDTRTFNPAKNNREEITAYGKYWNIVDNAGNLAPGTEGNGDLTSIPRYSASSGPCVGKSEGQCKFDTRFFYTALNNHIIEIVTANNRGYEWDNSNQFLPYIDSFFGYGGDGYDYEPFDYRRLYGIGIFGICYGKENSDCIFDTRTVVRLNNRLIESITAYGKGWNWDLKNFTIFAPNSLPAAFPGQQAFNLTSIDRYKNGPCAGKNGSDCKFDTRTFLTNSDGSQIESITAYGKYFNFLNNSPWNPAPSGDLTSVAKYTKLYDDRLSVNILPSDLQNPTLTSDPQMGKYDIPTSPVARTFTLAGSLNSVAAKVRGVPYKAEIAVDIYDNQYPAEGHKNGNYDTRIISSSNASENVSGPKTFTVNANYKAFVMYRLYNATAKFENMSLTYEIPNTLIPTPTSVTNCMQVERYARNPNNPNECQLLTDSCATPPAGWTISDDDPCPSLLTPQPTAPITPGATFTPIPTHTPTPTQQPNNYSILGTVYLDSNGNGQKDSNENAAPIGTPSIDVIDSTTSYAVTRVNNGTYHSDNLSPKQYWLTFTVPTGYKLTGRNISISTPDSGTCYTVAAAWTAIPLSECAGGKKFRITFNVASSNATVNFGIQPLPTATTIPTATSIPAATATTIPAATATSVPPTATPTTIPTATSIPPAATATSVPTTATSIPATPTSNALAADVDQNGCISINDFNAWLYAFWHNGTPTDTRFRPDMNGDRQVTLEDYNVWFSAYRAGQNLCQ